MVTKMLRMIALGLTAIGSATALAQEKLPHGPTDAELAVLPQYCAARLRDNAALKRSWEQRMGRDQFIHVHHFCFGMNFMNRAAGEFNQRNRQFLLRRAVSEFNYVLGRWPEGFPLTAEARNHKAMAETMLTR